MRLHAVLVTVLCLSEVKFNLASQLSNVSISDVCDSRDKPCLWKCCPPGQFLRRKSCVPSNTTNIHLANITVYDTQFLSTNKTFEDVFQLAHGILSNTNFKMNSFNINLLFKVYLIEDGNLYCEFANSFERWQLIKPDHFCVDVSLRNNNTIILVELEDETIYRIANYEYALLVSIVFLVLTVVPYCWFAQLRDLNAAILITFIISFTVPLALKLFNLFTRFTVQGVISIALFYHFFSVSSVCWTNVMFYRIRASACDAYTPGSRSLFLKYCGYTIGLPLVLTTIVAATEISDLSHMPWFITPQIIFKANYLFEGKESLFYLYAPLVLLLMFNWVVCLMNLVEHCQERKRMPMSLMVNDGQSLESVLNSPARYMCLLAVLTLHIAAQALAAYCPTGAGPALVHIVFSLTLCVGPSLFTIFVINRNVFQIVKKSFSRRISESSKVLYKNVNDKAIH